MRQNRLSPALVVGIIIAICVGVALFLRIALPYDQVFSGDLIRFTYADAYHYMRLLDNLMHNFPHLISFDPYMHYPNGAYLDSPNSFVYLLSGFAQLFGAGSPSPSILSILLAPISRRFWGLSLLFPSTSSAGSCSTAGLAYWRLA